MSEAHGPGWDTDYDLFCDTETFCETPIRHGTHAYAEGVTVMMAQWAVGEGEVRVEDLWPDKRPSAELLAHLANPRCRVVMHKSDFDRTVIRHAWGVVIPIERVWDTLAQAMSHSLPGGLDKLSGIYRLGDNAKQQGGKRLINLFCKPLPKTMKLRRATPATHPKEWAEFLSYGGADILSMRALKSKLPTWNYTGRELDLWRLDQRINDRGFAVDLELVDGAMELVRKEQVHLRHKVQVLTGLEVYSATQRDQMLAYILAEHGVTLPDMKKDTLERRLHDPELPDAVKQLIALRLEATTSSTAKYGAARRAVSSDGRLRGTLQFAGALRTGRWSGRLFQPQNMMRPDMSPAEIEEAISAFHLGREPLINPVMQSAANCMRGVVIASPGKSLFSSDLKNIEGRTAAWLAEEDWKIQAYQDYDDGVGPDLYVMAYAEAFGVSPEAVIANYKAGGFWRQVGKVMELAFAYGGGVGAWLAFAMVYRLDLEAMAEVAYPNLPQEARLGAEGMLAWAKRKGRSTFGLSDRAYIVCEAFKQLWREAHDSTSLYWNAIETAAVRATQHPGVRVPCGRLAFIRKGAWLRMILPSGRSLCYPMPKVEDDQLSYMGVNQYTRQWQRIRTYGGKLFENACQAVARDVMAHNMPAIEAAGFEIVLTVHDDVIAEASKELTSKSLSGLLSAPPPWLQGCPLSADGFQAQRYRKD